MALVALSKWKLDAKLRSSYSLMMVGPAWGINAITDSVSLQASSLKLKAKESHARSVIGE